MAVPCGAGTTGRGRGMANGKADKQGFAGRSRRYYLILHSRKIDYSSLKYIHIQAAILLMDDRSLSERLSSGQADDISEDPNPQLMGGIWHPSELAILRRNVDRYRNMHRNRKTTLVKGKIIPKIKLAWTNRYSEESLRKCPGRLAEWRKKKHVSPSLQWDCRNRLTWSSKFLPGMVTMVEKRSLEKYQALQAM